MLSRLARTEIFSLKESVVINCEQAETEQLRREKVVEADGSRPSRKVANVKPPILHHNMAMEFSTPIKAVSVSLS